MTDEAAARRLEGVIVALATPLGEDGELDAGLLAKQVAWAGGHDIRGFFVAGTTGEGACLATEEKLLALRTVKAAAPRDKIVCMACIAPTTRQAIEEMRALAPERPDFFVAVTPYYVGATQAAILRHFRDLAAAAPAPLIMYNIPQNTHNPMSLETILELSSTANIAGIKDSSGDFISFSRAVLSGTGPGFTWIQGEDLLEAASYLVGAKGAVSGLSNVSVAPYVEMRRAAVAGDIEGVRQCQRKINALFRLVQATGGKGIPSIKAAMELLGRGSRRMRLAALELSDAEVAEVRAVLASLNLIETVP